MTGSAVSTPMPRAARVAGAAGVLALATLAAGWTLINGRTALDPRPDAGALPLRLIDVNLASTEDLLLLPMIGPARAEAIIADRREHGPFRSIDELDRVPGIGPGIIARIGPYVSAHAPPGLEAPID